MSFTLEMNTLIQRYLKETKNQGLTLAEIDQRPHHKKVWTWWKAKAFYKEDGFYERIQDVPEGLEDYSIVDEVYTTYHKGVKQVMTKADCKNIYGGVI